MESSVLSKRFESTLKPSSFTTLLSSLAFYAVAVTVLVTCGKIVANWVRIYWYLRKVPRPKRVCKGPWFLPELLVCRYWTDPHLTVTASKYYILQVCAGVVMMPLPD